MAVCPWRDMTLSNNRLEVPASVLSLCCSPLFSQKKIREKEKKIMRKLFPLFSLIVLASLALAACGTPVAATPVTVEVTRIVTAEAPAAAADTPTAAAGGETPTAAPAPVAGGERLQAVMDRGK